MNRLALAALLSVSALAGPDAADAHHSQAMFVETPVWVQGTIVRYRPVDPHAMIELEERLADGQVRRWIVEGPRRGRLERILAGNGGIADDVFLKVGDVVATCGFPLKRDFAPERMYADWQPREGRFVHGQMLVMPDGRMQSWGPYGSLDNCVRAGDTTRSWISFLNRDPLAREQWCSARTYVRLAHHTPQAFLDEVHRGLDKACP